MVLAGVVALFSMRASQAGLGFHAATRHALEECMRAFVRRAGNVSKVGLQSANEKQEPI